MRMIVHTSFWEWYKHYSDKDSRFCPSEKGLIILKTAWERGIETRRVDMYDYMIEVMRQYDNPKVDNSR